MSLRNLLLCPNSAVRHNNIPFLILQHLWPVAGCRITNLYCASVNLSFLPLIFKHTLGLILKTPKKPEYSLPKAYWLISFEPTVTWGLEKLMERRLSGIAEVRGLLPREAFGGRLGRSTEDVLHYLVNKIKGQWRRRSIIV